LATKQPHYMHYMHYTSKPGVITGILLPWQVFCYHGNYNRGGGQVPTPLFFARFTLSMTCPHVGGGLCVG